MSFLRLMPFLPLASSSLFAVTRSIFDMIFIQGTSRLIMADMAESTPLQTLSEVIESVILNSPEKFVLVFHELGIQ